MSRGEFLIDFTGVPECADLDGKRLTTTHGFLNFVAFLAMVLAQMERSKREQGTAALRRAREYAARLTWADEAFERFEDHVSRFGEALANHLRCWGDGVDWTMVALAKRVAAAFMLRREPLAAPEAAEILGFLPDIEQDAWGAARYMGLGEQVPESNIARMAGVTRIYVRCLEITVKTGRSFRIGFRPR